MCKTISPFFYYSELKDMNALKVLSDTNNCKTYTKIFPSESFTKIFTDCFKEYFKNK